MNILEVIKDRRSVRAFYGTPHALLRTFSSSTTIFRKDCTMAKETILTRLTLKVEKSCRRTPISLLKAS